MTTKTTSWTARVEWAQPVPRTDDELADLAERLARLGGAIGVEKDSAGADYPETWSAVITLEAVTLRQASQAALAEVEQATGCKATGIEVLTDHEHQRRVLQPSIPALVGYAEIAAMAGVSRQRARQFADLVGFPAAVVETQSGPLMVEDQVRVWLAHRTPRTGRPPKLEAVSDD